MVVGVHAPEARPWPWPRLLPSPLPVLPGQPSLSLSLSLPLSLSLSHPDSRANPCARQAFMQSLTLAIIMLKRLLRAPVARNKCYGACGARLWRHKSLSTRPEGVWREVGAWSIFLLAAAPLAASEAQLFISDPAEDSLRWQSIDATWFIRRCILQPDTSPLRRLILGEIANCGEELLRVDDGARFLLRLWLRRVS